MTTLLDEPAVLRGSGPADRLRIITAAVRLSFVWFGTRKTLTTDQKAEAADTFGAEGQFLSAGKKLIDTRHEKFKAVSSVRSRAVAYWRSMSLPYPEPGIRLIRQERIEVFNEEMNTFRDGLANLVADLERHFGELRNAARGRLGRLYDPADYPLSLAGLFDMAWDFPSVEPPDYLAQLNPEIYEQECQRVAARFDEAVRLAEQAFLDELARLVSHLSERLNGETDGKPKVFRDSAVANLTEFFVRFGQLNIRSSVELDQLVDQARQIVRGVHPQELRDNAGLRQHIATQLSQVQATLDGLMVDRPRRRIIRWSAEPEA